MKILCVGPLWRGSNAGGLFKALARNNALIQVIDEFYYISLKAHNIFLKGIQRLIRPLQIASFNTEICKQIHQSKPDILFVYKGAFILPDTLRKAKKMGCKLVNFYPDVSIFTHGKLIPETIAMYDAVITTKTFGFADLQKMGVKKVKFVPHGFDPEIHRRFSNLSEYATDADVSFIGTWSPKKEHTLSQLNKAIPDIKLVIWGDQWKNAKSENLRSAIRYREVSGDSYALTIQRSKINLGILSEKVAGASSGDNITSRTFHIPASGGFLIHEKNHESVLYFEENKEAVFYDSIDDLANKVRYYLKNENERLEILQQGYIKTINNYSLDHRVIEILNFFRNGL